MYVHCSVFEIFLGHQEEQKCSVASWFVWLWKIPPLQPGEEENISAFDFMKKTLIRFCKGGNPPSFNALVLFLQLLTGKFVKTVTSVTENKASYRAKNEKVLKENTSPSWFYFIFRAEEMILTFISMLFLVHRLPSGLLWMFLVMTV